MEIIRPALVVLAFSQAIAWPVLGASFSFVGGLAGDIRPHSAYDVSADGSTVVGAGRVAEGTEALRWRPGSSVESLGELSGGPHFSWAWGASADGSRAVGSSAIDGSGRAVLWDEQGRLHALESLIEDGWTQAFGISDDGTVIVGRADSHVGDQAVLWTDEGGVRSLGTPTDYPDTKSTAYGVSGDGTVAVGALDSRKRAFIWDEANGMRTIGAPGIWSGAEATSYDGSTVVGWLDTGYDLLTDAFIWDAAQGMRNIGDRAGPLRFVRAWDVSADGSVVVGRGISATGGEAVVWTEENGVQSLRVLFSVAGLDMTGWELQDAAGISADGRTIVGEARYWSDGWTSGVFVAVIPEPTAALLLALGLCALSMSREHHADDSQGNR